MGGSMFTLTVDDVMSVFPRPLVDDELGRAENLVHAAVELIEEEFLRRGRDYHAEAEGSRLLQLTVKRVVREMITSAIIVGDNIGVASVSSTTGPESDSITYSQGVGINWGGVWMTQKWLRDLGLYEADGYGHSFPPARSYPGAPPRVGVGVAEFAERQRHG